MIAIGKLLDPKFLINALKIKLNGAKVYKDFVCLSENTTTISVTWSVTVVAQLVALTQKRKKLQISVCGINTGNIHEILLFCFLSLLFFPLKKGKEKKKSLFAYCHDKPQSYIEKEPTLVVLLKDSMDVYCLGCL